jgi:uncharacterized phage protein (TIGR02218 family)
VTYLENEAASIKPIEGYHFFYEDEEWLFTPEREEVEIGGLTFESEPTARGPLTSSGEQISNEAKVVIRRDHPMMVRFATMDRQNPFRCVIYRGHIGGAVDEYARIVSGDVAEVETAGTLCTIKILSVRRRFERLVPRYTYQASCNHVTYGPLCKLDIADFTTTTVLGDSGVYWGIEGRIAAAEINNHPIGYYDGGTLVWVDGDGHEHRRMIRASASGGGGMFYLEKPMPADFSPPTGRTVDMIAGDDHTFATCHTRFANTPNFGGFPYMRLRDPRRGII